jgi:cell division protein FtsI (penicillin-binding protein 3)
MKKIILFLLTISNSLNAQELNPVKIDSILINALRINNAENGLIIVRNLYDTSKNYATAFSATSNVIKKNTSILHQPIEPGSFMLPVFAAFLIDQFNIHDIDSVDLEGGILTIYHKKIYDAEKHEIRNASLSDIVVMSSNVGISKFLLSRVLTNDQREAMTSQINSYLSPSEEPLKKVTKELLPFVSFGYGLELTPDDILNFYSNIAVNKKIFISNSTTLKVKSILEDVIKKGTGKVLISDSIGFAGKTATIQVKGQNSYKINQYYSGFVGYFPKDYPTHACLVIIKCRPGAPQYYGAQVAGPIFKEAMLSTKSRVP